jgi:hypothetical protein
VDALTLAPAAGIFRVPPACAGPGGVVEEQVALRASATPQPVGVERAEFLDEAPGERRGQRRVAPDQPSPEHPLRHNELDERGAVCGKCIELSTIHSSAGEHRLGRVDRRPLESAQIGRSAAATGWSTTPASCADATAASGRTGSE